MMELIIVVFLCLIKGLHGTSDVGEQELYN
jgi:hypothetical protein